MLYYKRLLFISTIILFPLLPLKAGGDGGSTGGGTVNPPPPPRSFNQTFVNLFIQN